MHELLVCKKKHEERRKILSRGMYGNLEPKLECESNEFPTKSGDEPVIDDVVLSFDVDHRQLTAVTQIVTYPNSSDFVESLVDSSIYLCVNNFFTSNAK
jgi:hypothetical protein